MSAARSGRRILSSLLKALSLLWTFGVMLVAAASCAGLFIGDPHVPGGAPIFRPDQTWWELVRHAWEGLKRVQSVWNPFNPALLLWGVLLVPAGVLWWAAEALRPPGAGDRGKTPANDLLRETAVACRAEVLSRLQGRPEARDPEYIESLVRARTLVSLYGAVLENASGVVDAETLPAPKDQIGAAIKQLLKSDVYQDMSDSLRGAYTGLSHFQYGVEPSGQNLGALANDFKNARTDQETAQTIERLVEANRWIKVWMDEQGQRLDELEDLGLGGSPARAKLTPEERRDIERRYEDGHGRLTAEQCDYFDKAALGHLRDQRPTHYAKFGNRALVALWADALSEHPSKTRDEARRALDLPLDECRWTRNPG